MTFTAEERKNIITTIANTEIDQSKCPSLIITWHGHNAEYGEYTKRYFPKTGKITINTSSIKNPLIGEEHRLRRVTSKPSVTGVYVKYYEEFDLVHTCSIVIKANRGVEGEVREWSKVENNYDFETFMFLDDSRAYNKFGEELRNQGKFYNKTFINMIRSRKDWDTLANGREVYRMLTIKGRGENKKYSYFSDDKYRFQMMNGHKVELRDKYTCGQYHFEAFMKDVAPRKIGNSKINTISSKDIPEITIEELEKIRKEIVGDEKCTKENYWTTCNDVVSKKHISYAIFQNFENESIIRIVHAKTSVATNKVDSIIESKRIVISENGEVTIISNEEGEWALTSDYNHYNILGYDNNKINLIGFDKIEQNKNLKYIKSIIDSNEGKDKVMVIIHTLRHPIIEKFIKSGYPNIAKLMLRDNQINANIKLYFGTEKVKKNMSITEATGLNKFALKIFDEYCKNFANKDSCYRAGIYPSSLAGIVKLLCPDIEHYNKESIEEIFSQVVAVGNIEGYYNGRPISFLYKLLPNKRQYYYYSRRDTVDEEELAKDIEEGKKILRLLYNFPENERELAIRTYNDTVASYKYLDEKPEIDFKQYLKRLTSLLNLHDEMLELKLAEEATRRAKYNEQEKLKLEKLRKAYEERYEEVKDNYEYRPENSMFVIRYPKELNEIKTEGMSLGHCVGGYTDRHAKGDTNIVFLRHKDKENTSFYTIEVDRNNKVVQIHGRSNRWLGCNPEAIQFVADWLKEKKIRCSKDILLNRSVGYCSSGEYLDVKNYDFDHDYIY